MTRTYQYELDAPGYEQPGLRAQRERAQRLRDAGVRPAWGGLDQVEIRTVRRRPRWLAFLLRLLP
jgi:hypothetical protein